MGAPAFGVGRPSGAFQAEPSLTVRCPPPGPRWRALASLLGITLALTSAALVCRAAESPFTTEPSQQTCEFTVKHKGRKVLVYSFAPGKFKPYVKELCTIKGNNILRDAPFDHLHHHALMYAIRVNGVNFWEETPGCGVEKVIKTSAPVLSDFGPPQAILTQTLHWVAPQDAFQPDTTKLALLVEERTLTLTVDEAAREVALQWKSAFTVGGKSNQVTLAGANYFGLGMRFLQELDKLAVHLNAGGKPDLSGGKQDVTRHKWGSVSFDQPGRPATVVLFGHPDNPRGDSTYFSMLTAFPYLSATQGLDKEPLVYKTGDTFQLNYLITVYPEVKAAPALHARAERWEKTKN
jgi:hypothetical protein